MNMAAAATTQAQVQQDQDQHLQPPPSPPSPPTSRRRRHKKKHSDPFCDLSTPLPSPSAPSSPQHELHEDKEPLISRIILTPILFTSFLLSLFLVNRSDRQRRRTTSTSTRTSISSLLSYFSPSSWLDPEPYQDPSDTTWSRRDSFSHVEPHSALNPNQTGVQPTQKKKQNSWHLNKKIRKVAKLEINDAFEMRGRVIGMMVAVVVLFVAGGMIGLKWMLWMWWSE